MDLCGNITVSSGGLPCEYQPQPEQEQEQLLSSSTSCSSKQLGSLDDLFSLHNMEGDVSLEWLSIFVEDCFSSSGNCLPPVVEQHQQPPTNELQIQKTTKIPLRSEKPRQQQQQQQQNTTGSNLHKFVIPSKARSKRKRGPVTPVPVVPKFKTKTKTKTNQIITSCWWSHHHNPPLDQNHIHMITTTTTGSSLLDPPLLQQTYWLADSELILPKKEEEDMEVVGEEEDNSCSLEGSNKNIIIGRRGQQEQQQLQQGQARRCSHCLSQKTPQWRAGPLGPKTLCNACGVRYKSGRLLPEYRPAKSPTFVSFKHSNSHKKVMEMRMALPSSSVSNIPSFSPTRLSTTDH